LGVRNIENCSIDDASARDRRNALSDYLPDVYQRFRTTHPEVAAALDRLGAATEAGGSLDMRTQRLVKLGIAVGALAEGAVRSNARRARSVGATPDEIRHVALLAITTRGFPAAVAALGWIEETLDQPESSK
jgi:4-carboxymuconolactone decarboxylase